MLEEDLDKALESAENAPNNDVAREFNKKADQIEGDLEDLKEEIAEMKNGKPRNFGGFRRRSNRS